MLGVAFFKGSKHSLGSLAGPLESHLESPWRPKGPKWLPTWPKMDPKTGPKRRPEQKTANVSKTHYLLCFSHILDIPGARKMLLFSSKNLFWLAWPSFGHQGVQNKPLGWHLQAILGGPGPPPGLPGGPQTVQKGSQKPSKITSEAWLAFGMSPACPQAPPKTLKSQQKRPNKCAKNVPKKARWRPLREALLDNRYSQMIVVEGF